VALRGPSGSGKTTLLHMLGVLERPDAGRVWLGGVDAWAQRARGRARLRARRVGFVFQRGNLLDHMTVRDNVALAAWHGGASRRRARADADALLERFGLRDRAQAQAAVLSPGEAQRAAIARALIHAPQIVLADEPTGSLDSAAAAVVLDALAEVTARGAALIVVTHDGGVAARWDRQIEIRDGRVVDVDAAVTDADNVADAANAADANAGIDADADARRA
jgi:putative ABC transport system ATP-binding protein